MRYAVDDMYGNSVAKTPLIVTCELVAARGSNR
jgi:hypothetical protein